MAHGLLLNAKVPKTIERYNYARSHILAFSLVFLLTASLLQAAPKPRVAVVLSGGSALGLAHVGVLQVIERAGIPIDMILGTSMGSIVGGLYAAGYSPDQLDEIVTKLDWRTVFSERRDSPGDRYDWLKRERFSLRVGIDAQGISLGAGLLEGQNVLSLFTELTLQDLTVRDFDKLPVPYRAVATDIVTGEVVISHGSIAEAMRSSMSIPGIFHPYTIEGRHVVDGGIADNMPVDVARQMGADIVIAVESRLGSPQSAESLNSRIAITGQTLNLLISQNMVSARKDADLVISPDLHDFNMMSYTEAVQIVERGRQGAEAVLPRLAEIAALVEKSRPLVKPEVQANRSAYRPLPVLASFRVEGGSASDQAMARSMFAPLAGKAVDRAAVRKAIDTAYATGRFDLVTFDMQPAADAPEGNDGGHGCGAPRSRHNRGQRRLLGENFRTLFTTVTDNETELMAGAMLRNISGRDSALYAEVGLLDTRRLYAEYFQPLGPFFLMPFFKYESQFDGYYISMSDVYHTLYQSTGGGLALFSHSPSTWTSWPVIFRRERPGVRIGDPSASNNVCTVATALRVDTFSTTIFSRSPVLPRRPAAAWRTLSWRKHGFLRTRIERQHGDTAHESGHPWRGRIRGE